MKKRLSSKLWTALVFIAIIILVLTLVGSLRHMIPVEATCLSLVGSVLIAVSAELGLLG